MPHPAVLAASMADDAAVAGASRSKGGVGAALTHKIGPLPLWAYAVIGGGIGFLYLRRKKATTYTGGTAAGQNTYAGPGANLGGADNASTDAQVQALQGSVGTLSGQLSTVINRQQQSSPPVSSPNVKGRADWFSIEPNTGNVLHFWNTPLGQSFSENLGGVASGIKGFSWDQGGQNLTVNVQGTPGSSPATGDVWRQTLNVNTGSPGGFSPAT